MLVIGAGIGGLTAALALRQAGADAEIYEAAPTLESIQVGYGIHLWSNATRVLRALGVAEGVEERSERFERMHIETVGGRTLFDWPLGEVEGELGEPIVGINRSDLHAVLASAVGTDTISFGARLERFEQGPDSVTARFANGSEARGDVLVGADGVRSTVRRQLFDEGPEYLGLVERHATIALPEGLVPPRTFHEYWSGRHRFGFYPIKGGTCWYLLGPEPAGTVDADGHKQAVQARLGDWPDKAREVVDATPADKVVRLEVFVRKPSKRWGEGRVTLLGDAAHAMEPSGGQGSAQAIEDAMVLAGTIGTSGDPVADVREYERRRIPRVGTMRRVSTATGLMGRVPTPVLRAGRNAILPAITPLIWKAHKKNLDFRPDEARS